MLFQIREVKWGRSTAVLNSLLLLLVLAPALEAGQSDLHPRYDDFGSVAQALAHAGLVQQAASRSGDCGLLVREAAERVLEWNADSRFESWRSETARAKVALDGLDAAVAGIGMTEIRLRALGENPDAMRRALRRKRIEIEDWRNEVITRYSVPDWLEREFAEARAMGFLVGYLDGFHCRGPREKNRYEYAIALHATSMRLNISLDRLIEGLNWQALATIRQLFAPGQKLPLSGYPEIAAKDIRRDLQTVREWTPHARRLSRWTDYLEPELMEMGVDMVTMREQLLMDLRRLEALADRVGTDSR
jgi:hypothetical protein